MNAGDLAVAFTNQPSLKQLEQLIDNNADVPFLHNAPNSQSLEVYSALLQSHAATTFTSNSAFVAKLSKFFATPAGLGCLVSHLNVCAAVETKDIVTLIETVLTSRADIVPKLLHEAEMETIRLLFGSRLLSVAAAKFQIESWIGNAAKYSQWLAGQFLHNAIIDPRLFDRAFKLGGAVNAAEVFLSDLNLFQQNYSRLRASQQDHALAHGIIPLLPKQPGQAAKLMYDLRVEPKQLMHVCLQILPSTEVLRSLVVLAKQPGSTLSSLIVPLMSEWANKVTIERSSLLFQQVQTQLLVALGASLTADDARKLSTSTDLTVGVQNHLLNTSQNIRNLGTLVAEVYAKQSGAKLDFGITYSGYNWWIGVDNIDNKYDPTKPVPEQKVPESTVPEKLKDVLQPKAIADSDDEEDTIFGDEAESDEEVPTPYYLKDLLEYLRSDKYPEVYSALTLGANLIRRKALFGSEVAQYGEEILRTACSLTDKYSIKDFAELRQSLINAVLIADPDEAPKAAQMLATGDWFLAQRQSLLAAFAQAAHTLGQGEQELEHERLPEAVHRMFVSPQDTALLGSSSQRGAIEQQQPISGKSDALGVGTVTRRSKYLEGNINTEKITNKFAKVSPTFFYPLLAAQPPLRASSYDALVYAQWLRTLAVIIAEAYPSNHVPDMIKEMWPLLRSLVQQQFREPVLLEAIFSSLLIVLSVSAAVIVQNYASDIGLVFDLVVESSDVDNIGGLNAQTAKMGRRVASELAKLMQSMSGVSYH